ncbi:protein-tyrosine phosphatase-like protein [Desarmillaria tabescens]|uniref:Protein-tyrosine phosphatase-like protein n=1 Tax=Armillaria tabescens TaxID=1929756 RepID=A0AA39N6N7_ARMTA|nr:protein-tyrosine phosphatase-like protein [Desarmillaria tabescens]KAK0459275.1 protein-tyrosine phosphatase-like protein [Desarmillaria tabescens]
MTLPIPSDASILSLPPFIQVQGVINIRMVGGYKTATPSTIVKPGTVFRCGELSYLTENGKQQLISHGIRRIFDLRSDTEISSYSTATPDIEGVASVRVAISEENTFDPTNLALRLQAFDRDEIQTFLEVYEEILTIAGPAFNAILRHLIDKPEEPILVHCTAGKDRTGLVCAVLLMILGVDDQDIVNDYALTTHGLEPAIPMFTARLERNPVFRSNFEGAVKMGSSRPETMVATLQMIREKFGGAEGYIKAYTSLGDEDIEILRQRLLVAA